MLNVDISSIMILSWIITEVAGGGGELSKKVNNCCIYLTFYFYQVSPPKKKIVLQFSQQLLELSKDDWTRGNILPRNSRRLPRTLQKSLWRKHFCHILCAQWATMYVERKTRTKCSTFYEPPCTWAMTKADCEREVSNGLRCKKLLTSFSLDSLHSTALAQTVKLPTCHIANNIRGGGVLYNLWRWVNVRSTEAYQRIQRSSLQLGPRVGGNLAPTKLSLRWPEWTLTYDFGVDDNKMSQLQRMTSLQNTPISTPCKSWSFSFFGILKTPVKVLSHDIYRKNINPLKVRIFEGESFLGRVKGGL